MVSSATRAARLRKTFRYPTDDEDGSDSLPEAMDEQEQEQFISQLAAENTSRNSMFRAILLALPLIATLIYIPLLFRRSSHLVALLSLTSLLSTAWLLHQLPPEETGIAPLDAWTRKENVGIATRKAKDLLLKRGGNRPSRASSTSARSRLHLYLPYLNLGLATILIPLGTLARSETLGLGWINSATLPITILGAVLGAKLVMGSVDPARDLKGLKYDYKGA